MIFPAACISLRTSRSLFKRRGINSFASRKQDHSDTSPYRGWYRLVIRPGFQSEFCLRDGAWIHPAYMRTKRGDVGTTRPTVLARQKPLPKQSKYRLASPQHHSLIIAQAWNGCSCSSTRIDPVRYFGGLPCPLVWRTTSGFHRGGAVHRTANH